MMLYLGFALAVILYVFFGAFIAGIIERLDDKYDILEWSYEEDMWIVFGGIFWPVAFIALGLIYPTIKLYELGSKGHPWQSWKNYVSKKSS